MTRTQALARLLGLFGVAWFAFWACAPMMSAPPATPMDAAVTTEIGGGANWGQTISESDPNAYHDPVANLQAWFRNPVGPNLRHEAGMLAQMGIPSAMSFGGYYRFSIFKSEGFFLGPQIDMGWLWVGTSLPMAVKLSEQAWLTTMPAKRGIGDSWYSIPLGFSWKLRKSMRLDMEGGVHLIDEIGLGPTGTVPYVGIGFSQGSDRDRSAYD